MIRMKRTFFAVTLVAAIGSTSCSSAATQSSARAPVHFTPPAGWQERAPSLRPPPGFVAMWRSRNSEISLSVSDGAPSSIEQLGAETSRQMIHVWGARNVLRSEQVSVCNGGHDGWLIEYRTSEPFPTRAITVMAPTSTGTVIATYTRPDGSPAEPAALAAVKTLCSEKL